MRVMHILAVVPLLALGGSIAAEQPPATRPQPENADVAAVRAVIDAQADAWNRGDVAGYMEGYAKADSTTFVSGDTVTRGWQTVLDRYKTRYDTRQKMGTLRFTALEFQRLCDDYIMADGRWQLTRDHDTPHGRFTLVFRRTPAGWRIVHDHTSSAS